MRIVHCVCRVLLVFACGVSLAAAQTGKPAAVDSLINGAREALTAGRADEAAAYADQALAAAPLNRDAAAIRMQAAFAQSKPQDAFRVYDSVVGHPARHDSRLLAVLSTGLLHDILNGGSQNRALDAESLYRLARGGEASARSELERRAAAAGGDEQTALLSALARLGDPRAAQWFGARVQSSSGGECVEWMRLLARLKLTAQADVLLRPLADADPNLRAVAATSLGALAYRAAIPQLRELLNDTIPIVRMDAAVALKRLGDSAGDSLAAAMLQSPVAQMRLMGAEAYQGSRSTQWVERVRELLSDSPDPTVRLRAAELLADADKAFVRSALVPALDSDNPNVRMEAARILEEHRLADPTLIRRLLENPDPWVRMHAAGAALAAASDGTGRSSPRS